MGWFSNLFKSETKDWFYSLLQASQTPSNLETKTINPNEEYLSIMLKSMRIVNVRKGFSTFYATVHSHIEVNHISGKPSSFNTVTTPGNLERLDSKHIDKIININRRLLGPVPFRGGDTKLEVGLFGIKEANLAEPFIKLLTDMSTLGGVSFITTALPYVKPLEQGIELLTGSGPDSELVIGLNMEMTDVNTGYYVVMKAEKGTVNAGDLKVDKDFKLVDKNGASIKDYPYMVFEISSSPKRDDWFNIPDVSSAYNKLQLEVQNGKVQEAGEALVAFKRVVYTSPDLLLKDAKTIYSKVEGEYNDVMDALKPGTREKAIHESTTRGGTLESLTTLKPHLRELQEYEL